MVPHDSKSNLALAEGEEPGQDLESSLKIRRSSEVTPDSVTLDPPRRSSSLKSGDKEPADIVNQVHLGQKRRNARKIFEKNLKESGLEIEHEYRAVCIFFSILYFIKKHIPFTIIFF